MNDWALTKRRATSFARPTALGYTLTACALLCAVGSQSSVASPHFQSDDRRYFDFAGHGDFVFTEADGSQALRTIELSTTTLGAGKQLPAAGTPIFLDEDVHVTMKSTRKGGSTRASMDATIQEMLLANAGNGGPDTTRSYETQLLKMDLASTDAADSFLFRVFPSVISDGRAVYSPASSRGEQSGFLVESFFDVFFELSFDGGQTWQASGTPLHLESVPAPAGVFALIVPGLFMNGRRQRR